jgi:hypothetical protein
VALRSIQTRVFDTTDREKTLRTAIATLQDLGFVIDKADADLGAVSATKLDRYMLRMTVTVRPKGQTQALVRANAQYQAKEVNDPEPYQNFFVALERAMFLTAHLDAPEPEVVSEASSVASRDVTVAGAAPAGNVSEAPSVITSDASASAAPSVGTGSETPSVISAQPPPPRIVDPAMKARVVAYLDSNMRKFELAMREYDGNLYQRAGESHKPKVRSYEVWEANEKRIVLRVLFRVYHPQTNLLLVQWVAGDLKVVGHRDAPRKEASSW